MTFTKAEYTNKTNPRLTWNTDITGEKHEVHTHVMYAKHKDGKYRDKQMACGVWGILNKTTKKIMVDSLVERAALEKSKGRYHDWFFTPKLPKTIGFKEEQPK